MSSSLSGGSPLVLSPPSREGIRLSKSKLETFWTCEQKYVWAYKHNIILTGRPTYFDVGMLVHEAVRVYLHPLNILSQDRMQAGRQALIQKATKELVEESTMYQAILLYESYSAKLEELLTSNQILATELWVECSLGSVGTPSTPVTAVCKADALMLRKSSNQLWIYELKTQASLSAKQERALSQGPQVVQYHAVLSKYLRREVFGTHVDVILKLTIPRIQTITALNNAMQVDRWMEAAMRAAYRMNELHFDEDSSPRQSLSHCLTFMGECPYLLACQHGISNPQVRSMYETRKEQTPQADQSLMHLIGKEHKA